MKHPYCEVIQLLLSHYWTENKNDLSQNLDLRLANNFKLDLGNRADHVFWHLAVLIMLVDAVHLLVFVFSVACPKWRLQTSRMIRKWRLTWSLSIP